MNKSSPSVLVPIQSIAGKNINYFKIKAKQLVKQIQLTSGLIDVPLHKRLSNLSMDFLLEKPSSFRLKHGLAVIAQEHGFKDWRELKSRLETEELLRLDTYFCRGQCAGMLNHWFTQYQDARDYHLEFGGVLLPYRNQFFVATVDFVERFGMAKTDSDWQSMGYDWVYPHSESAKTRLVTRLGQLERITRSW